MMNMQHRSGMRADGFTARRVVWPGLVAVIWLVLVAPLAGAAGSPREPHRVAPAEPAPALTQTWQIASWLRRLVGSYRVEGSVFMFPRTFEFRNTQGELVEGQFVERLESARGAADCAVVGTGAGMQCIFNVGWTDQFDIIMDPDAGPVGQYSLPGGVAYLNPSMLLVGLDPGVQGIGFLLVDSKGLPEGGSGFIAGDRATLRAPCVNARDLYQRLNPAAEFSDRRPQSCERITHIDARAGADLVHLSISIELNEELVTLTRLTLRRADPQDLPGASGNSNRRRR